MSYRPSKFYVVVALLVFVSTVSHAAVLPPIEFDRPFKGTLTVHYLSRMQIFFRCWGSFACAYKDAPDRCRIYLPAFDVGIPVKYLFRHERGHCLGWPAHHPGARFVK